MLPKIGGQGRSRWCMSRCKAPVLLSSSGDTKDEGVQQGHRGWHVDGSGKGIE